MAKLNSINPTNGEILGSVKIATKLEVEETVKKAALGFLKWKAVPLAKRANILLKLSQLMKKEAPKLGKLITQEMGKPLIESVDEVQASSETVKWFAIKGPKYLADEPIGAKSSKVSSVIHYEPRGVVAAIKPWNFPVDTAMLSIAPALLAGNSVVFKPSENVPLVSEELVKLIWEAGIPKDVLMILQGRGQVGTMLVDTQIDMVSFTGSTEIGQEIAQKCGARLIKYVLELGGSSAAIVCKDADLDLAAKAIVWGRFSNNGQVCNAIKRVLVENSAADQLIAKLEVKVRELRVGDPLNKNIDLGPLVSEKQLKSFEHQVTRGVIQGGRITVGGRRLREEQYSKGYFHEPTLMIHVTNRMEIMQEEVFGPLLPVCRVESLKEAIKATNDSKFGLTAAVFTKSKIKAKEIMGQLEVGSVYVNDVSVFPAEAPWCGLKQSGAGVEGGKFGLWEFVHKTHWHMNMSAAKNRDYWFPY
ncbi:MAG: aldehyde dehydrogenase family protein [Patescibacteria group bacterium]|nr:aldehyde dehydrogenase family protein [Patescibacteria group bacterium]